MPQKVRHSWPRAGALRFLETDKLSRLSNDVPLISPEWEGKHEKRPSVGCRLEAKNHGSPTSHTTLRPRGAESGTRLQRAANLGPSSIRSPPVVGHPCSATL